MNQASSYIITLDENEEYINKSSIFKRSPKLPFESHLFSIDNILKNEAFSFYKSQNDSSEYFNKSMSIKYKSYSLYNSIISFQNKTQNYSAFQKSILDFPFSFSRISNDSNDSIFSNKKRRRSKNNNTYPNIKDKKELFKSKIISNYGRKKAYSDKEYRHNKYSLDGMRARVETYTLEFLLDYFNTEI